MMHKGIDAQDMHRKKKIYFTFHTLTFYVTACRHYARHITVWILLGADFSVCHC